MRTLPALAKATFVGFILTILVGLAASLGTRFGFWSYPFGLLTLFPWCLGIGTLSLVAGVVWILWAMIANDSSGARFGLIGLVGAAIILYGPLMDRWNDYGMPRIADASTDTENAPPFVSLLTQRDGATTTPDYIGSEKVEFDGKPSTVSLLQHKYYAEVHTAAVLISPERLFKRAVKAAYGMGWSVIAIVPDEGRVEATDITFFFGATDDIVIRVKPAGMGAKLDIRSKSRTDTDDGGRNVQRVRAFLKRLATTSG